MADVPTNPATWLPPEAPAELRSFLSCEGPSVTIHSGPIDWVRGRVPGGMTPTLAIATGRAPGSAAIKVGVGFLFSASATATVVEGRLVLDTSGSGIPSGMVGGLQRALDDVNDWFRSNGKALAPIVVTGDSVTLTKTPLG